MFFNTTGPLSDCIALNLENKILPVKMGVCYNYNMMKRLLEFESRHNSNIISCVVQHN